jgi:hypothetical protein
MGQPVKVGNGVAPNTFAGSVFAAEKVAAALDPDCSVIPIAGGLPSEPVQ